MIVSLVTQSNGKSSARSVIALQGGPSVRSAT